MNDPSTWPWASLGNVVEQWAALPSFVLGQVLFISLAVLAFVHAMRSSRVNQLVWWGALVAGTVNDLIFMALPLVDNFWHAQGLVMLTPRMPLYIPCVYICFMYFPTVAVRAVGLSRMGTITLAGLAAMLFYAPYDIVGAKFLWWTWHDTDAPIAARILGAPCSSSLWVLTFVGAFVFWIDHTARGKADLTSKGLAVGLLKVAGLTTLTMMVQMTLLQLVDGGTPGYGALAVGATLYAAFALRSLWGTVTFRFAPQVNHLLVFAYLITLAIVGAVFDPATHVSTGVHQEIGECYVEQTDITRQTRFQYLCAADYDEPYLLACDVDAPASNTWYTVCGTPSLDHGRYVRGLWAVCVLGFGLFVGLAGWRREDLAP